MRSRWLPWAILVLLVARAWWPVLGESLWLDESLTSFVLRHGPDHPSLDAAPGVRTTIYYPLLGMWRAVFGAGELALRLPSLLLSLAALYFVWRIAARLIHPHAAWIAVFLCFVSRSLALRATEARPYALALALAAAGTWLLIRYLDGPRKALSAVGFCACGALLVWTHILLAPFLAVCFGFAVLRGARWSHLAWMGAGIAAVSAPVAVAAIGWADTAAHVFMGPPSWLEIVRGLRLPVIVTIAIAGWALGRRSVEAIPGANLFLFLGWWLFQPLLLAAISHAAGTGLFVRRYFVTAALGAALVGAWLAARFIPRQRLQAAAWVLGAAILLFNFVRPVVSLNSPRREAAALVSAWAAEDEALVLCPSGFIEAQPPVWNSGLALPHFLYADLDRYPVPAEILLLPNHNAPDQPVDLVAARLAAGRKTIVFGRTTDVDFWEDWLARQSQLAGWKRSRREMGDLAVAQFAPPVRPAKARVGP